jgi:DNA-binding transcriptional ArsR family regulator
LNICSYVCVIESCSDLSPVPDRDLKLKSMKIENITLDPNDIIGDLNPEKLEKVAFILKTIAHPLRISIIGLLVRQDKLCVNDICEQLGSEQSLTSHHLSNMKLSGILGSIREGKNIYYYLKLQEVVTVIHCMNKCNLL